LADKRRGDDEDRDNRRSRRRGFDATLLGPTGIFGNEVRMRFDPRIALLDNEKIRVVGDMRNASERQLKEITYDNQVIGYLAHVPRNQIFDNTEIRFAEEQGRTFSLIALVIAIISTIIALPLSRSLVKPIQSVAEGSKKLASGEYSARIQEGPNDEIGSLARDFNSLAHTLEQNEQARRKWIADISHELRTPLAILRGEIEALQDGIRKPTADRLDALHKQILNLNHLVGDLYELSLSDIGALNYQKESVNIVEIIEDSMHSMLDDFETHQLTLIKEYDSDIALTVFADQARLTQLFTNLLINSLRYTDEGGHLIVKILHDHSFVTIEFIDTAPGVPAEDVDKLFDRLFRLESSRNRETGGAGLGLSICSNIVEAHEGLISAQQSPEGGLWITVKLPVER
jgi:two-component system sensor histidine kinase BaeS